MKWPLPLLTWPQSPFQQGNSYLFLWLSSCESQGTPLSRSHFLASGWRHHRIFLLLGSPALYCKQYGSRYIASSPFYLQYLAQCQAWPNSAHGGTQGMSTWRVLPCLHPGSVAPPILSGQRGAYSYWGKLKVHVTLLHNMQVFKFFKFTL